VQVRVKRGTTDPDYADIPLGGWAGTVREGDHRTNPPTYLVEWTRSTLQQMHPIYRKRCERDGLELESMWLDEDKLEPDTGEAAIMEQPTNIRTRPLNEKDQDDRVRMALGLTGDDPLPEVDDESLQAYHRYLAAHLSFPFEAAWSQESGPFSSSTLTVTIKSLGDPEDDSWADEICGLLCQAKLKGRVIEVPLAECEAKKDSPNQQLLKDYASWFWNYR
jgi:hypothetical protein